MVVCVSSVLDTRRLTSRRRCPVPLPGYRFSERRIGLDHLAIGVSNRAELEQLAEILRRNGVAVDLHHDPLGPAVVTFRYRDNIQWEFPEQI